MKRTSILLLFIISLHPALICQQGKILSPPAVNNLRAPAYPLITIDPYTSIWSFTDKLYDENPRHWTGTNRSFTGALRVDNKVFRFMGNTEKKGFGGLNGFEQCAVQKKVNVLPTQTWYTFECGPVLLDLIFTSPLLTDDLDLLSRPVNYLTWQVKSNDSKKHQVEVYIEISPEWAANSTDQQIKCESFTNGGLTFLKTGTVEQPVLAKQGDDLRIDWGYLYLVSRSDRSVTMAIGDPEAMKNEFCRKGFLSPLKYSPPPITNDQRTTVLSVADNLGEVGKKTTSGFVMIGYDDIRSIRYFGSDLPAYWTKKGPLGIKQAFALASDEYQAVVEKCSSFNSEMMAEATKAGGEKYAELCALAYRQAIAAHKLTETGVGELLFLSKENFSNGCIGTVDVTYPSAPLFLLYNPNLLKGMLNGIFYYSESGRWTYPFVPHDLGTYPVANGQINRKDGSERLMPVEESGNMLILATAISVMEGNAGYAEKHWASLSAWADYLVSHGLDPDNQLCTDDFAGFLAHNVNLSLKAIMGIAGYGKMAGMLGMTDLASEYELKAKEMAKAWIAMAKDGDHYKLAFDRPGTWSQKYNLVWDKLLGFNLFPEDVAKTEIEYYMTRMLAYGLPLDNRKTYTKSDWVMWTAVLADDPESFRALTDPIWKYVNETQTRMPISDWHETTDGNSVGMRARSVVGGYFMKMLEQKIYLQRGH